MGRKRFLAVTVATLAAAIALGVVGSAGATIGTSVTISGATGPGGGTFTTSPGWASARPRRVFSDQALLFGLGASRGPFGFGSAAAGSALVGSAPVGKGPDFTAVDPATHTLYVTNGFNEDGDPDGGNTVSVIDTRHCQAADVSNCKGPWPTLTVGSDPNADPSAVAIDQQTDTLYVRTATTAAIAWRCSRARPAMPRPAPVAGRRPRWSRSGRLPVAGVLRPGQPHLVHPRRRRGRPLDARHRDLQRDRSQACPTTPPPTVTLPGEVTAGTVDLSTHTVYVTVCGDADFGCPAGSDGVSVFNASTCNATVQSGCHQLGPTAHRHRPLRRPGRPCQPDAVHGRRRQHDLSVSICVAATRPTSPAARATRPAS